MRTSHTTRPFSLVVITAIFVLVGVTSAYDWGSKLFHGSRDIDLTFLSMFIGWGLWRLRPAARLWALAFIVLGWIGVVA